MPVWTVDPDFDAEPKVLRLYRPQDTAVKEVKEGAVTPTVPLPDWASMPAAADAALAPPLVPSRAEGSLAPGHSPIAAESDGLKRGRLIHNLLQRLPDLAPARRRAAAAAWLAQPGHGLEPPAQAALRDEVMAVLDHPGHAALFAPGTLAEVPISGMIGVRPIAAQVDRLVVTDDSVTVVDYKTDRPVPTRPDQVAAAYLAQMAAYRAALRLIYPRHTVRCTLLWTEGPKLMVLPDGLLDRYAP